MNSSCQSCGMPLKKDPLGGGTNGDGTTSEKFCSHCYREGNFVHPEISVNEMKDRVKGKMTEMGIPKFLTGMFTLNMHKLDRWK
ncbi:MAG: zinc ribbon domain-containing protein [Bacteroidota bacterium]